ncbi:MAG: SAM-dependent chlorinase/fluorinase, partial [Candidatus Sulfotelmatobacter sp.]
MIEKREGFAKSAQGLKPARILDALRGAEAPLFHGAAGFRGGPHFHGGPRFHGDPHFHGAPHFHGGPHFRGAPGFPGALRLGGTPHSRGIRGFRSASRVRGFALMLLALIVLTLSVMAQAQAEKYPQTIVFMTDFGVVDDSVALCRGVMYSIMPQVRIVDLTHEVTPFSILDGARFLYGATPYFPAGTVFVVVIDPTVGSTRKAIVAKSKRGQYFVLPDNGLLTLVEQRDGIEGVYEITNPDWM